MVNQHLKRRVENPKYNEVSRVGSWELASGFLIPRNLLEWFFLFRFNEKGN